MIHEAPSVLGSLFDYVKLVLCFDLYFDHAGEKGFK